MSSVRLLSYGLRPASPAQRGDEVAGRGLPVVEERPGARVEECESRRVHRPPGAKVFGVQRLCERVRIKDVHPPVPDERRHLRQGVDDATDARADLGGRRRPLLRALLVRGPHQVQQMCALGLVELERPHTGIEHLIGDPAGRATLEAGVVLDADPREKRDLLASRPATRALPAVDGQARASGRESGAASGQELADVVGDGHRAATVRPTRERWEVLPIPLTAVPFSRRRRVVPCSP